MPNPYGPIARRHLDEQFDVVRANVGVAPSDGWLRSIRLALGMTSEDLAHRLGVSAQAVRQYERAEMEGTIRLSTLTKVAEALEADVRYVVVPRRPLSEMVTSRAHALAARELGAVDHSMALEQQLPDSADNIRLVEERARELVDGPGLWRPVD